MKTTTTARTFAVILAAITLCAIVTSGARYEELTVTSLILNGDTVTNTGDRLNAALSAGDSIPATPSATIGSATIQSNVTVGGTLGVTGVLTLSATPKLAAALTATGTAVVAAGVLLPEGYSTNAAKFIAIAIGTTNYVIPMYVRP